MIVNLIKCGYFLKKIYGLKVKSNKNIKDITSFKIGGKVRYFVEPKSLEHFILCYHYISKYRVPYYCVGNATNLLVKNKKYNGVVVKIGNNFSKMNIFGEFLTVQSGALLNKTIMFACKNGLCGMEEGFGIPGSVGGAVYMNASSFGYETAKVVESVLAMVDGKIKKYSNQECEFGYRTSIFQKLTNVIILEVSFMLSPQKDKNLLIETALNSFSKRKAIQPLNTFNAGSVFKNPKGLSAGKLIDECGLKGYSIGGARVSLVHANFIENFNNATYLDVLNLIKHIKNVVKTNKNIDLEVEIKSIGEKK